MSCLDPLIIHKDEAFPYANDRHKRKAGLLIKSILISSDLSPGAIKTRGGSFWPRGGWGRKRNDLQDFI
jgi:hypothetical protein